MTVYVGLVYVQGDPRLSKDNTFQTVIPGTSWVIDAAGIPESTGKGQAMNECWDPALASGRIRAAPNGLPYCLVSALGAQKKGKEIETTYNGPFWKKRIQWSKLSDSNKVLAAEAYKINPATDLYD